MPGEQRAQRQPESQNPPGDYDYRRFIEGVEKHFPKTCFFMSWNAKWSLATNQNVKALLEHPSVANREELPKGLFGDAGMPPAPSSERTIEVRKPARIRT